MTPEGMREVAVAHLQRFPCSAAHLRRVLMRKINRSVRFYEDEKTPLVEAADAAIASLDGGALLDDDRYARARVYSQHRRGRSRRAIAHGLRAKGVKADAIDAALTALDAEPGDSELIAATRYAQRRRLGPFRRDLESRAASRRKDLAALGRQGFRFDVARQVIDGDPPE